MLKKTTKLMALAAKFIAKAISYVADDALLLIGVSSLSYGVFQIYIPAGHITLGICFIAIAYIVAKRKGPQ